MNILLSMQYVYAFCVSTPEGIQVMEPVLYDQLKVPNISSKKK